MEFRERSLFVCRMRVIQPAGLHPTLIRSPCNSGVIQTSKIPREDKGLEGG